MASKSSKKLSLPKAVLEMKFMKKTRDRIEKERQNTRDHDSLYSNIITNEMRQASGNFITESSFIFCEDLLDGRLSFKGMNPEIERLMELENCSKQGEIKQEIQKDVSDEILVEKMGALNKRKLTYDTPVKEAVTKKRWKK